MKIARIIILTVAVLFLAAATATAERSLWLYPKNLDGTDIEDAYVGRDDDPWLRKSYVVGGDPFLLEISNHSLGKGKKDKTAKNVRLVLAINDPDKVDGILIDGEDIWDPDSVKYGIPKLASGWRMPKHGVFPTSFIEVDIGDDIPQNGAVELEIDVNGDDGLMVHFDAYGKGRPKKCKGKHHHKHCKYKSHHKHYKDWWHLKHCYWKYHHKHCHSHKTCFRDVFNPFSHDVTVVIEESVPPPICELTQLSVELNPSTIELSIPDNVIGTFAISVTAPNECNSDELDLGLSVDLPVFLLQGTFERPVFTNVTAEQNGQVLLNTISWNSFPLPSIFQFGGEIDVNVATDVYSIEVQLEDLESGETVSAGSIDVDITGGGVPIPQ